MYVLTSTHCVLLCIIIGSKVRLAGGSKVPDIVIFCSGVSLIAKTVVYEKTTVCFIALSYCLYVEQEEPGCKNMGDSDVYQL